MQEFIKIIKELINLFQEMIPLEEKKIEATKDDNLVMLEDCMKKEQAATLRLKGLENEREKSQEKMGVKTLTFRQILEQFPDERAELQPLFAELTSNIQRFQDMNEGANTILKTKVFRIENAIHAKEGGIYSETGAPVQREKHFTNTKA